MKTQIIKLLENILFRPLNRQAFSRFRQVDRLCFINMGGLGDYMLFSPMVKICREQYPNAHITMVSLPNFNAVTGLFPEIDTIITVPPAEATFGRIRQILTDGDFDGLIINQDFALPAWALSLAIALSGIPIRVGCGRNPLREAILTAPVEDQSHQQDTYLMDLYYLPTREFLHLAAPDKVQRFPETSDLMSYYQYTSRLDEQARLFSILAGLPDTPAFNDASPRIVIHPGSSKASKSENWTKSWPAPSWAALMIQLLTRNPSGVIYLTGGPDDEVEIAAITQALQHYPREQTRRIVNLYGKMTSTSSLAELLSLVDCFIGCDSFAMHLALYCQTPIVPIFALTNEKRFLPTHHPLCHVAARQDLDCRPCVPNVRSQSCDNPVCLDVPVSEVLKQVNHHLTQPIKSVTMLSTSGA